MSSEQFDIVRERSGFYTVWRRHDIPLAEVNSLLEQDGEMLKQSDKSETRRVGSFVVKASRGSALRELLRHTARRNRYRQGWRAAIRLAEKGIPAPRPVAHVERGAAGVVAGHATVFEFLQGCVDVEHFADRMLSEENGKAMLHAYLARLAASINRLNDAGAIHTDLAGKNILTRDGHTFYFIDLDGVELDANYTTDRRFHAHVQLYDSFIDRCGDDHLAPFLRAMLPADEPFDPWFQRVKMAQAKRRARTVAAWAKKTGA